MKLNFANKKRVCLYLLIVVISLFFLISAKKKKDVYKGKTPKYVFLFIGDGMAIPQINSAEAFLSNKKGKPFSAEKLSFSQFPSQGMTTTYAENRFITGSAAAATALACGQKTNINMIAMAPNGKKLKTLVQYSKDKGLGTGIISSTRLTHATPAAFMAHNESRNNENEIAEDIAMANVDFLAGGGYRHFVPKDWDQGKSKRKDSKNLLKEMEAKGYKLFVTEKETSDFLKFKPKGEEKVAGFFTYSHLSYEIDRVNAKKDEPSLAEMTKKGIEVLSKYKNGFFMMVEGGRIDHACHANDAVTSIYDTLAFNAAVKEAIKFYNKHKNETIVIVTGDHETGGMTLGFAGTKYESDYSQLNAQKISYEHFDSNILKKYKKNNTAGASKVTDLLPQISKQFGLKQLNEYENAQLSDAYTQSMGGKVIRSKNQDEFLLYGSYEPLTVTITHLLNQRAGISFTTYSHTATPLPTFAMGLGEDLFNGYYDNTDIFHKIAKIMKISAR